jgi:hypothetical protein
MRENKIIMPVKKWWMLYLIGVAIYFLGRRIDLQLLTYIGACCVIITFILTPKNK